MVDLTRRKTVIGLGLLATGSGATFTSAAFQNTAAADSDLRVIVQEPGLEFEGNSANSGDPKAIDDPDFFEDGPSGGLNETADGAFDDGAEPLAFAEGSNEDLTVKTAVPVGQNVTVSELFRVANNSNEAVTIGVAYDRENADFDVNSDDSGQYGADVSVGGGSSVLNEENAQSIYQFKIAPESDDSITNINPGGSNTADLLSPEPGESGVEGDGSEGTSIVDDDLPATVATIPTGDTLVLDLEVNTASFQGKIEAEADIDQSALGLQTDTVQIIDGMTIVTIGDSNDVTSP
jgi:hypothetical protein